MLQRFQNFSEKGLAKIQRKENTHKLIVMSRSIKGPVLVENIQIHFLHYRETFHIWHRNKLIC